MDLSVCIVSWNVRGDLQRCLESVREGAPGLECETFVVDNASEDGSAGMVAEQFPEVELVVNTENLGFAAANVQAMERARGRYVLLLNPDTLVPPGALMELVRRADAHPEAGVVGPKLVYGDGSLQYSCRRFPTVMAAVFRSTVLGSLLPLNRPTTCYLMSDWTHDEAREVDWVSGACMLIRREVIQQVGMLDTRFFWGSEDVDYCWRARKAGWKVLYTPEPVITHFVGRSTDRVQLPTIIRTHRSMYRLYSKHLARNAVSRGFVWLGVWARAGLLVVQYAVRIGVQAVRQAAGRLRRRQGGRAP